MLRVALKEWSIICELLAEGRLTFLLRKGGIHEDEGPGAFRLEHRRFALFPSWAHQRPEMIKPGLSRRVEKLEEPPNVTLSTLADAAQIWEVPSRASVEALDDLHPWSPAQIDMRFDYKSDNPLYLVALRCHRLAAPQTVVNDWSYGGCKSWVELKDADTIDDSGAIPVLDDDTFGKIVSRIDAAMKA